MLAAVSAIPGGVRRMSPTMRMLTCQAAVGGNFFVAPRAGLQPLAVSSFHQGIAHLELRESRKVPVSRP